ncbi:MAG: TolC family protein, partial [Vicinamibacterales bacterium]|nr:TolC family protein [Vicinamibacterales bacterium]
MHSTRTVVATLLVLCGLTATSTPGVAQSRRDLGVAPNLRETPVTVGGIVLPAAALQPAGAAVRHLSVEEAVTLGLEQNLDLRVERLNPQIQDLGVAEARSVYTPMLSTTLQGNNRNSPSNSFLSGGEVKVTDRLLSDSVDVVQDVPWAGGRYSASWDNSHSSTTNIFSSFDPILRSNLTLNYTQPLLRNLRIDSPRQQIAITRANR